MLDLELRAELSDHCVIEICIVVCDNPLGDAIPTNQVVFDEMGNHIFGDRGERGCFNPFCKVVNGDEDEAVFVRSCGLDFSDHIIAPHCEWPRRIHDI